MLCEQYIIDTETVKVVYKALHNDAPKYLKELFHRLSDIQTWELRNSKTDLHIPLLRKSFGTKMLCIQGSMHLEQPHM